MSIVAGFREQPAASRVAAITAIVEIFEIVAIAPMARAPRG